MREKRTRKRFGLVASGINPKIVKESDELAEILQYHQMAPKSAIYDFKNQIYFRLENGELRQVKPPKKSHKEKTRGKKGAENDGPSELEQIRKMGERLTGAQDGTTQSLTDGASASKLLDGLFENYGLRERRR